MTDMMFNIGPGSFRHFKKMISALNMALDDPNQYRVAANEIKNSKWAKQVGKRMQDIVNILLAHSPAE